MQILKSVKLIGIRDSKGLRDGTHKVGAILRAQRVSYYKLVDMRT